MADDETGVAVGTAVIEPFLRATKTGPYRRATLFVWHALLPHLGVDTGEITISQDAIAERTRLKPRAVQGAYKRLVELGMLLDEGGGKYRMHPDVAWKGDLAKRELAARRAPTLTLV